MIEGVFRQAMNSAAEVLDKTKRELRALECPKPEGPFMLHLRDLGTEAETLFLKRLPTGYKNEDVVANADHVYVFGLNNANPAAFAALCKSFGDARTANTAKAAAYCRPIKEHRNPGALYVGRSKHLRTRIAQHLDAKEGRTYAMHMGRWATSLDVELSISFITFRGQSDTLVQAVEDGLWIALQPALGKHGAR